MHTVFSYDLKIPAGERRNEVEDRIKAILEPFHYVRRLTTYYIIHVTTQAEWDSLLSSMTALAREIPEVLHFIMSPPMEGGKYNGFLPRGDWDKVNEITNM